MTDIQTRPPAAAHRRPAPRRRPAGSGRVAALLVTPTLLVLTLVVLYPTLQAVRGSLYGVRGLDPQTGFVRDTEPFVGLANYAAIFGAAGGRFWNAFGNTTLFTVTSVVLEALIGVAMALIMHRALRGRALVRASILVPWAVPTAVVALLWRWIFNANGVANALLPGQVLWTTEGVHAKLAVVFADTWKTAPFIALLVLAGLQMIPLEVYEAAKMDGATALRRFWHITLPLVEPALLVAVLFRILDVLRMFDLPYILIGPRKASVETLSMLAQDEASNVRFGPAAAYAVILFLFVFLVAFAFVKLLGADVVGAGDAPPAARRLGPAGGAGMTGLLSVGRSTGRRAGPRRGAPGGRRWLLHAGILAVVGYCLAPFYWMVVSSLRRTSDIFDMSPLPSPVTLENYAAVLDPAQGFGRALLNSVIVAGTTTLAALTIATLTGYAMARLEFRFKRLVLTTIIATSMFPVVSIVVPLLRLFTRIGWINTYQAMIVPSLSFALPLAVWILTAFFRQMPVELEHAAMIDGCTRGQAFRKIILPLAAPGVVTTAIITFVAAWNEFLIAVTMTNKAAIQTAPVAISKFTGASQFETPFGSQMAAGVLVTIPLVILVLLFQRRIVAGLTAGAVK